MIPPAESGHDNSHGRPKPPAWRWHAAALACYAALAGFFIDHGESLTQRIAGQGTDPFAFVWFLAWWPWALTHHLNPFFTALVWQPEGVYLNWVTSVPLLAVIGWPLTVISPVLTFNFFILCAPVLAAWMGYFLCLRTTRQPEPAILGGFLFGFSSYEMAQDTATLNLSFTACVPLLLLLILTRLDDEISRVWLVLFGGLVLICQFLLSIEIFGMIFCFGGLAWALALAYLPERRPVLRRLAVDGLWTAPLVLLALSPFLVSMALHAGSIRLPSIWPYYFAADLLNFIVPSRDNLLGGLLSEPVSAHFNGGIQEQDGYIGLPLLLMVALFAREKRRAPAARMLVLLFLLLLIASLGPRLWIGGQLYRGDLPWALPVHLPLLASAEPTRFALFVSLLTSIIAVLWMAPAGPPRVQRQALGLLACVFLLPQLHPWIKLPETRFFQPGRVQAVLGPNARILVLPFGINGPSPFWQQQSQFGFLQTGGYLGFPPRRMSTTRR
jgi:hypothetical protein